MQGGSGGSASVAATYGAALPQITVPTLSGYVFGGYFTATGGGGVQYYTASGASVRVWDRSTDTILYAKWTSNIHSSTYIVVDLSGGANATSYPVTELEAEPSGGWTEEYKTTKLVLRKIPAGKFTMGSPSGEVGRNDDHETQHSVTISKPFYIGVFEVTQKQWKLVTGTSPSYYGGDLRPVECVSYDDIRGTASGSGWPSSTAVYASSFMGRLRARTGIVTFDLPTEAKWEYACRAGTKTALNSGKNLTSSLQDANMAEVGRYEYNNGYQGGTQDGKGGYSSYHTTVGSYLPNSWGLYDMHGNVWEWCLDWWQSDLGSSAVTDPVGPSSGSARVKRGGSWRHEAQYCRSAYRSYDYPSSRYNFYGFRLCCSAGQ